MMGGFGSGRRSSSKPPAESINRLDLARLRRGGSLKPGTVAVQGWSCRGKASGNIGTIAYAETMRLIYRTRGDYGTWQDVNEVVSFTWTETRYGGRRQWFCCPGCGGRCRVLFGRDLFRCRRCHGVRYNSQAETRADRATRAMFKIVNHLDPTAETNQFPRRRKGMHRRTYESLADRYDRLDRAWATEVMRRFGIGP